MILNISHDLNTDVGFDKYRSFDEGEWMRLLKQLLSIRDLCTCNKDLLNPNLDSRKTIGEITAERSAVVVRLDEDLACKACQKLSEEDRKKFCLAEDMPIFDRYTGTDDFGKMASDQLKKLHENGGNPNKLFLLSWTLTQSVSGAIFSTVAAKKNLFSILPRLRICV